MSFKQFNQDKRTNFTFWFQIPRIYYAFKVCLNSSFLQLEIQISRLCHLIQCQLVSIVQNLQLKTFMFSLSIVSYHPKILLVDWKEGVWEYLPNTVYNLFLYLESVEEEIVFFFGRTIQILSGRQRKASFSVGTRVKLQVQFFKS